MPNVHTVPCGDGWANEVEGTGTVLSMYASKDDAVAAGRAVAEAIKVEHIIHDADGTVAERNRYDNPSSRAP